MQQRQRRRQQMGERVRQQRRRHLEAMVVPWGELSPRGRTIAARSPPLHMRHATLTLTLTPTLTLTLTLTLTPTLTPPPLPAPCAPRVARHVVMQGAQVGD